MSKLHQSCVSQLKVIEESLRCTSVQLIWNGTELSPRNNDFIKDLYVLMSCIWLDVSLTPSLLCPRWVREIIAQPVDRLVSLMKDVDFQLLLGTHSSASFNHWRKLTYPDMGQILAPLSRNIHAFLDEGSGLSPLRTALRFITRANFPEPLGQEEEAFATWQEVCLKRVDPVDVSGEAELITQIFPRRRSVAQLEEFHPKFGPGASYGLSERSLVAKYCNFGYDPTLYYAGIKAGFLPTELPRHGEGVHRNHRVHFVPKQLDKLRVVSMEPCSLMFYQLGIMDYMVRRFASGSWSRHIDLHDADKNRDLAWEGSLTGEYATIDLSSASDSVRYWLVRELFHKTSLRELLIATRSRFAEYEGSLYEPTYFAPMGSGCCFPVECAVFASIVDRVMRTNRDRRAWRVYGDDIICPCERADEVIDRLTVLGFKVNVEKSFYDGNSGFRESCGGDYFKGENVRPVYVSRKFSGLRPDPRHPQSIASLIDQANSLWSFKHARQRILAELNGMKLKPLYSPDGEVGVYSPCPTNHLANARWNEGLQREEYFTGCLSSHQGCTSQEFEDIRLFEYLRAAEERSSVSESVCAIGPASPLRWTAKWQSPASGWSRGKGC